MEDRAMLVKVFDVVSAALQVGMIEDNEVKEIMDMTLDELKNAVGNSAETDGTTTVRQLFQKLCKELDSIV